MIEFLSVYFSLVAGLQPVEVRVAPVVAAVELRLDGAAVAELAGPPWRAEVDFGPEPAPHQLEAIARDAAGRILGRVVQGVDLPEGQAGARIALERAPDGRPVAATVAWNGAVEAEAVHLFLDGAELPAGGAPTPPIRVALPAVDPAAAHVLVAELAFPGNSRSTAIRGFGGELGAAGTDQLTAVVMASPESDGPPAQEVVAGVLRLHGRPQRPLAVLAGGGDVVVVLDPASAGAFAPLLDEMKERLRSRSLDYADDVLRLQLPLRATDRLSLLWAEDAEIEVERGAGADPLPSSPPNDLFSDSPLYDLDDSGLSWLMARYGPPPTPERVADAVCVAGSLAVAARRPRAVVLVVDPATADGSLFAAAAARRYLARLGVPLLVWTAAADPGSLGRTWGEVASIATWDQLAAAVDHLRARLDAQAVVWLAGRHAPGEISIAGGFGGSGRAPVGFAGGEHQEAPGP